MCSLRGNIFFLPYLMNDGMGPPHDTRILKAYSAGKDGPPTTYVLRRSPLSYYRPADPELLVECLTPDFRGEESLVDAVATSGLDVFARYPPYSGLKQGILGVLQTPRPRWFMRLVTYFTLFFIVRTLRAPLRAILLFAASMLE